MDFKAKLKELGVEDSQVSKILSAHNEVLKGEYIPKHRFDEINEEKKSLQTQVSDRDKQIKDLEKFKGTDEELRAKIADLEKQNKESKDQYEKDLASTKMENAIKLALTGKVQDIDIVSSLLQKESFKINEKGEIEGGFNEQLEKLKSDKSFLFVSEEKKVEDNTTGFKVVGKTPDDSSGSSPDTAEAYIKNLALQKAGLTEVSSKANDHYFNGGIK